MTRFVTGANATEAAKPSVVMAVLVDMDFASGHLRVHDGLGTLSFGGNDYVGVGQFGGIEGSVNDSVEVIARPLALSLSGVDSSIITAAMTEDYQGRAVVIYLGFLDATTRAFVGTPETIWEGRMDYMQIEKGPRTSAISVKCEHRLRREPRIARYTLEDQQLVHPTDRFLELVTKIAGFKSQWGDRPSTFSDWNNVWRAFPSLPRWKP